MFHLLEDIKLKTRLTTTTPDQAPAMVREMCAQIDRWMLVRSRFRHNASVFVAWAVFAFLYLAFVAVAYVGGAVEPHNGESVFNIIDVGLYATLVEYTGGLASPMWLLFTLSVAVAILGAAKIVKENSPGLFAFGYSPTMAAAPFAPVVAYLFALSTELLWSGITHKRQSALATKTYLTEYGALLLCILVTGAALAGLIYIVAQLTERTVMAERPVQLHSH